MPPPTAADVWLAGRRFGIVIDAGSSGSRLQIYSWRDARLVRSEQGPKAYHTLPKVEKGTENADDWVRKAEPGISSFGVNPDSVASYLAPLLDHAREHIPPSLHHETSISLLATAGMRLLPQDQKTAVLDAACDFIRFHSHFRVEDASPSGRCGSSVRIITGEEEGLFGWVAVNYLMDQFTKNSDDQTTYGFLDMGGASTQIAFEPSTEQRKKTKDLIDVRLRLIGGEEIQHQVFVTTWLGYGTNQARERYVGETIARHEKLTDDQNAGNHDPVPDPCLPRDLQVIENSAYLGHEDEHSRKDHTLVGTGSYEQCLKQVSPLLNKDAPCPDVPCLFNGVHVPHIDFSVTHFIGVSEYWYSSEHVFGLGGPYNFVEFERAASEFCSRDWDDISRQHELSKEKGTLGGDGEVEEGGQIVDTGKWGDEVEIQRLQMQCFKSAWLVNVLHNGIGMPRIVDADGNPDEGVDEVEDKANQKGLGKPILQSLDSIGDTAISWTLGKMVLEASREVPP
ncbi:nucleoside phosphatase family-domain-containing protein, partial [Phellopilus nigrolimitatus]